MTTKDLFSRYLSIVENKADIIGDKHEDELKNAVFKQAYSYTIVLTVEDVLPLFLRDTGTM